MEIGNHVEYSHRDSEDYGERDAHDGESDAVEHCRAQGYQCLAAEVAVHAVFYLIFHAVDFGTVFDGNKLAESFHEGGVVNEDEDDVDECEEPFEGVEEEVDGGGDEG